MNRWLSSASAAFLGISLLVSGCGNQPAKSALAPLVKTQIIGEESNQGERAFSGTVHGYYESPLAFEIGGRILQRYVQAGQRVSAGDPLFRIDAKDAQEQVSSAQGALSAAQAQYQLAQTTMARYEALHRENAVSDLTMDQTRNSYEVARAQMDQAQAALARTQNNLGFTVLRADRDGLIGSTLYEEGQVVSAGTPVVEIVDDSKKDVYISLPEKEYSQYSVGMPCTVTFWAAPGITVSGVVREIAASPNSTTGTYDTKITLQDPPDSVVVGMTASVHFGDTAHDRVFVPLTAMAGQSGNPSVWVVRDGKVHLTAVTTGEYGKDTVEILSGLRKGDRIVTAGSQSLSDGEEVRL